VHHSDAATLSTPPHNAPQEIATPKQNSSVLIAKQSSLSSRIVTRLLETMGHTVVLAADEQAFDQAIQSESFLAIFADESFIRETNKDILAQRQTPIVLTSNPENQKRFEELNYTKVDSVLSKNALEAILNTVE
jgi:CheY-like chemotaxis protein